MKEDQEYYIQISDKMNKDQNMSYEEAVKELFKDAKAMDAATDT
jgi:hypothetical protein